MEEVANSSGGMIVEGRMAGGYAVEVAHAPWTLTLGLHAVSTGSTNLLQTRVHAHFTGREDFKLVIRPRSVVDRVARRLGFEGSMPGGRVLSERYVVRGRPASRVRSVLSGGLGDSMLKADAHRVEVRRASWWQRRKTGAHSRLFQLLEPEVSTDADRMLQLIGVARTAMDVLERVGIALGGPSPERPRD